LPRGRFVFAILTMLICCGGCAKPAPEPVLPAISATVRPGTTLRADPDPVVSAQGETDTTILWSTTAKRVDLRFGGPNGALFGSGGPTGSERTDDWVRDGMTFFLQDADAPDPQSPAATLGSLKLVVQ
jgi:hypothetical protein